MPAPKKKAARNPRRTRGQLLSQAAVAVDNDCSAAPAPLKLVTPANGLFRRRRTNRELESRSMFGLMRNLGREHRAIRRELEEDPNLRALVNDRMIQMAEDDGLDVEEDRPFLAWLIKNLPAIIAMIVELINGASVGGFG